MGNELTTTGGNAVALSTDDYYAALAAEAASYRGGGGGPLFLKFNGNDGNYSYGSDDTDLPLGTQVAMNPRSLKRGWICWKDGQVQEEIMMALEEGLPPAKHLLPDYGPYGKDDGWSEQKTIEFTRLDGSATVLLFQANNKSKMNALEAIMKDFARQYKANPGCVPIVELDENEFETQPKNEDGSKGRKVRKHAPKFSIVEWMSDEELMTLTEGAQEDYAEGEEGYVEGADQGVDDAAVEADVAPEPEPEAEPARGGRRQAPAPAAQGRVASQPRPATPAPAPAARPAPAQRPAPAAAPAAAAAPRGRRF
jgi:hypothetical protein